MNGDMGGRTILVVVAHPDDAEACCGGTLARLAGLGNRVILVICTNGERGSHDAQLCPTRLAEIRRAEQRRIQEMLVIQKSIWLGYRDGQLSRAAGLRDRLGRLIREIRSETIAADQPCPGIREIICHPGYVTPGLLVDDYNENRELELRILTDPHLQEELARRETQLVTYAWLRQHPSATPNRERDV
jgi:hypothetical protein